MATVAVIGASRGIGLESVKRALEVGHAVRALARGAITVDHPALEKIGGDALDPATIARTITGADAALQTLGATGAQSLIFGTDLFSKATRVLIDAMRSAGVSRLVTVTGLGAGDSRGHGGILYDWLAFPLILKRVYDDKDVQEQMIKASGLEWTIVRPGLLTNGPAIRRARALSDRKDWRAGTVSRADVAEFIVREAFECRFLRQTPLLIDEP
jgi:putative NADH-flavin reductase